MNINEQGKKDYKEFLEIVEKMNDKSLKSMKKRFNVDDKVFYCFINYKSIDVCACYKDRLLIFNKTVFIIDKNKVDSFQGYEKSYNILSTWLNHFKYKWSGFLVLIYYYIITFYYVPNVTSKNTVVKNKGCDAQIEVVNSQILLYEIENGELPTSISDLTGGTHPYLTEKQGICPNGKSISIDDGQAYVDE